MRIVRLILFCIVCFLVGIGISISGMYLPEFVRARNIFFRTVSSEASVSKNSNNSTVSPENSAPAPLFDPSFVEPISIKNIVTNGLKTTIDKDHHKNFDQTYNNTKKEILAAYNSGKRDRKTVASYLYLASLENNQKNYQDAAKEWCHQKPEECLQAKMPVLIRGRVLDEGGAPVSRAYVFVLGEDKKVSAYTDNSGNFSLTFVTLHPRRIRLLIQHPEFAGGSYTFVSQDPRLTLGAKEQIFEKDFTIIRAMQKVVIDTNRKKVISGEGKVTNDGYLIENNFSKYLIPFDSIRKPDNSSIYKGKVFVSVFEFNRQTANAFLQSDVFDKDYGFASEGLKTYSMPLIFFYDDQGRRLEVFKKNPMIVWTTNRELHALIMENSQGKHQPGFNPAEYDELASPENVEKYIKEDEMKAYTESQKDPSKYPITMDWIYNNDSRLAGFFVYDQTTGIWEATGYSLVAPSTDTKHSLKSLFWTKI